MPGVGRTSAQTHGEEGEHGGDDVPAGLDPGGDQPEAAGRQPHAQLERHQQSGGGDGEERAPPHHELLVLDDARHPQSLSPGPPASADALEIRQVVDLGRAQRDAQAAQRDSP